MNDHDKRVLERDVYVGGKDREREDTDGPEEYSYVSAIDAAEGKNGDSAHVW